MGNFLAIFQLIIQLLPLVTQAVQAVEQAIPQGGQGAQKLAIVRGMLESAFKTTGDAKVGFEQVWPSISVAISGLVTAYNAAGRFNK